MAFITTVRNSASASSNVPSSPNNTVSVEHKQLTHKETTTSSSKQASGITLGRLSPAETKEIANMLARIGYGSDKDIKRVIRQYQKDNGLSPSGYLDVQTLDKIVSAVRLDRVQTLGDKFRFE